MDRTEDDSADFFEKSAIEIATEDNWKTGAKPISECLDDWSLGDQRRRDDLFDPDERPQRIPSSPAPNHSRWRTVSSSSSASDSMMADNVIEVRKIFVK